MHEKGTLSPVNLLRNHILLVYYNQKKILIRELRNVADFIRLISEFITESGFL